MRINTAAIIIIAALCAPSARAFVSPAPEPFAAPAGPVLAQVNSSTDALRWKTRREHVLRAITRVSDLYTNGAEPIWRCMGEMNIPRYHWSVASLAILGMRLQQGRYVGASGDQLISEQLHPAAGTLLSLTKRNCLKFPDAEAGAAWVGALDSLTQE